MPTGRRQSVVVSGGASPSLQGSNPSLLQSLSPSLRGGLSNLHSVIRQLLSLGRNDGPGDDVAELFAGVRAEVVPGGD